MTDKIDDGGPAFPLSVAVAPQGDVYSSYYASGAGMSLRDWYAGMALQGLIMHDGGGMLRSEYINYAKDAYAFADAMIAARKK